MSMADMASQTLVGVAHQSRHWRMCMGQMAEFSFSGFVYVVFSYIG